jgi:hypothetical protein
MENQDITIDSIKEYKAIRLAMLPDMLPDMLPEAEAKEREDRMPSEDTSYPDLYYLSGESIMHSNPQTNESEKETIKDLHDLIEVEKARKIKPAEGDTYPLSQDDESLDNSAIKRLDSEIQDSAGRLKTESPVNKIKPSFLRRLFSCFSCSKK